MPKMFNGEKIYEKEEWEVYHYPTKDNCIYCKNLFRKETK